MHVRAAMNVTIPTALAVALAAVPTLATHADPVRRLSDAATALVRIMSAPDRRIPDALLERAHCIVIVPGLEVGAFVVTGKAGRGYVACRRVPAGWSAPAAILVDGGRVGFHVGGSSADLVMLVMNAGGADRVLDGKYALGAEGTVEAGPLGRTLPALTAAQTRADVLTWSWSNGSLSGVALEGATLHQDLADNAALYGRRLTTRDVVRGDIAPPEAAAALLAFLGNYPATNRAQ